MTYQAPVDDILAALKVAAHLDARLESGVYGDLDADTARSILDEVSKLIWDGSVEGWNEGTHLAEASARAGLDLAELDRAIEQDPGHFVDVIEANQKDLEAAGHWGVPTMVFEGEPFFGQDRLDLLRWRLERAGLGARSCSRRIRAPPPVSCAAATT